MNNITKLNDFWISALKSVVRNAQSYASDSNFSNSSFKFPCLNSFLSNLPSVVFSNIK